LQQTTALIIENESLGADYYRMTFAAPEIAAQAQPGQFLHIRVAGMDSCDPLLPRPLSIYRAGRQEGTVAVIFRIVGRGTAMLAGRQAGEKLTMTGPIGNGFTLPTNSTCIALIAGGVGMPPLFFLASALRAESPGMIINLFYGGRSREDLLEREAWEALNVNIFNATDDGSTGWHGLVTELFRQKQSEIKADFIAACGPEPMLKAMQKIALESGLSGQLSLESHMACGIGACLGCVCETKLGRKRVCVDGPVFAIGEVDFE
jgi:dihydroorotate dehydrogenase electron transfer subunit